jgi:hypothetical protein
LHTSDVVAYLLLMVVQELKKTEGSELVKEECGVLQALAVYAVRHPDVFARVVERDREWMRDPDSAALETPQQSR